jgi:hypothetical protein
MISRPDSNVWYFVYDIPLCFQAFEGSINLLRSRSFLNKLILFFVHNITFGGYVALKKREHPWLICRAAISLIFFNLKNLNPHGTGYIRYSFKG